MKRSGWFVCGCLILGLVAGAKTGPPQSHAQADAPLVLLETIDVGGRPESIVVDRYVGRNDVIFRDLATAKVRFIDGTTLALASEEIYLPSWGFETWMAYDRYHHQTYALQVVRQEGWNEVLVHRVGWRSRLDSFSVNAGYNDPVPVDDRVGVDGLVLKQPMSEGENPGRLIIDNTPRGTIDVVDLNPTGTAAASLQRYSYRDPTATGWYCNQGNSLALETRHETLAADDLASTDIVYISDQNRKEDGIWVSGYISVLSLDSTVAENQLKNGHQEGFPGLYSSQLGEIFRP